MRQYSRKQNRNKINKVAVIVLMVLLLAAEVIGVAMARYISRNQKEAVIHASNFHFSSNYLNDDSNASVYTVSDWGSHNITFYLFNYEQENVSLISDSDITYTISVPDEWNVQVCNSAGDTITPNENSEYTMEASTVTTAHRVTLTYAGDDNDVDSVLVKVVSTSPYEKTMSAEFTLSTKKGVEYTVEDKGNYNIVTIYTNDYYGTVTVTWNPATHSPDNTCEGMGSWKNSSPVGELSVQEFTTYTLIFVENKIGNYDTDAFKIAGA